MKRLTLFIGIMAVIAGGILLLAPRQGNNGVSQQAAQDADSKEQGFFEPPEQLTQSIIAQTLGAQFNAQTATHTTANLDNTGGQELIIGAIEDVEHLGERPITATIQVVTVQNPEGEYERIGQVEYQEWMRGVPEVKELRDVTGDSKPEAIVALLYGGASSSAEGVLQFDIPNKKVRWLQIQTEEGMQQDAIFVLAGSVGHHNTFVFRDIDENGSLELIEVFAQVIGEQVECSAFAYTWNGEVFAYSPTLSSQTLSQLSSTCEL